VTKSCSLVYILLGGGVRVGGGRGEEGRVGERVLSEKASSYR